MNRQNIPRPIAFLLFFLMLLMVKIASAECVGVDEAALAIEKALPPGWSIVEQKTGEIPWGHHWCGKYDGVKGTKITIRGKNPSKSRFLGRNDQWRDVEVGAEALEVWIMPGEYRDSLLAWFCLHRPIQPTLVTKSRDLKIYARPSSHSNMEEKGIFDKEMENARQSDHLNLLGMIPQKSHGALGKVTFVQP